MQYYSASETKMFRQTITFCILLGVFSSVPQSLATEKTDMRTITKRLLGLYPNQDADQAISPDNRRWAYCETPSTNESFVIVDGLKGKVYDETRSPGFSPDSKRLAYVARSGNKHFVVVDGKAGKGYDKIKMLSDRVGSLASARPNPSSDFEIRNSTSEIFGPDSKRIVYVACSGSKCFVVTDGEEGPSFDDIKSAGDIFSPNSKRVAYRGQSGEKWTVVIDGKQSEPYTALRWGSLVFSPNSKHVAYVVDNYHNQFAVIDEKHSKLYSGAQGLIFSPDSKRLAYIAMSEGNRFVVVDGKEGKIYDNVNMPIFSSDSKRVAYVATSSDKYFVVVDGNEGKKEGWHFIDGKRRKVTREIRESGDQKNH